MEPAQKTKKPTIKPKKTKPFFGPKMKGSQLNKLPKKAKKTAAVPIKKPVKKANPESDKLAIASLKKPVKEIQTTSQKYQKHKESNKVLEEAQSAAILPSKKANETVASRSHVEVMDAQTKDTKQFDKKGFKTKLQEQIDDTIKSKKDAEKIQKDGVDENVTKKIGETVGDEKTKAGGKVESSSVVPPAKPETPSDEATNDEPQKLVPVAPSAKTSTAHKTDLAPKSRPKEETDLTKETEVLDDDYKQNNLSKEKLQNSNEPKFIDADNQKQDSETKAQELTDQTRANEKKTINATRVSNSKAINGGYDEMLQKQSTTNKGRAEQQSKKSQEEKKIRDDVHFQLTSIFDHANKLVLASFAAIDLYIEKVFGASLTRYLDVFSERVADLLADNTGFIDVGLKVISGDEVLDETQIFDKAKEEFIDHMQKPIDDLVDMVDKSLSIANKAIQDGRQKADEFWSNQSSEAKRIAGDIYEETNSKFTELEQSVESKEGSIIDTVTEKFSAALDELDERFEKAKIENMSWLDRAIAAVKSVINTIIELKNAIQNIAKKAAAYAERIIDDPITFFGNLADGVGQGFTNFKNNIDKHLIKGVLQWLTGSMEGSEIILPKELNFEGITSLVLQILGISIKKIKGLVIDIIGKERFEFIEKGVDATISAGNNILNIFKILNEKGLEGLWEFIKEEFSDLKEMLIENVKTFVIETITQKAVEYLLSLLIPGAGFIRAAQLLIKFVVTLFQKAAQILKIIEGIIDTFGDILNRNLSGAAAKVENVFSNFLSLAISFLAAVLGLNGIVSKVQKFIQQKIRPKIDKVLNNIAKKVKQVVEKIGLTKIIDKSMKAVDKGKAWVEDKKKKVKDKAKDIGDKILTFLGLKKPFKLGGKESHTLVLEDKKGKPVFYTHSTPQKYADFIKKVTFEDKYIPTKNVAETYGGKSPEETAQKGGKVVDGELAKYEKTDEKDRKAWGDGVVVHMNNIADVLTKYAKIGTSEEDVPSIVEWEGTNSYGLGKKVDAKQLTSNYIEGQETNEEHDSGGLTKEWGVISQNKGSNSVYYYVRGHLLNAKVGGVVNNTNLTPLSKDANKEHLMKVERAAKKVVTGKKSKSDSMGAKGIIQYSVEAIYGSRTARNIPGLTVQEQAVSNMEETTGVIPTQIKFKLKKLMIDNGAIKEDPTFTPIDDKVDNHLPTEVKLKK